MSNYYNKYIIMHANDKWYWEDLTVAGKGVQNFVSFSIVTVMKQNK